MRLFFFFFILFLSSSFFSSIAFSQPLSAHSRWIVDESGQRVKLACVNWPSHMEAAVAEGLSKKPVDDICQDVVRMGFNCVRLTWPLFLFTDDTLAYTSVRQSLKNLGLFGSISGFQANNPSMVDLALIDAYQAVVASLARSGVMVVLDNHISKPGWCCSKLDGNGFFGDKYFNTDLWIQGLTRVATMFNGSNNVVAMSLRNELRGPKQNTHDWYRYMEKGAEAVHAANPDVLVVLSGLKFDRDLSFLAKKPVSLSFSNKTVFELHWYGFSDGNAWETGNPNRVCGKAVSDMKKKAGFLLEKGYPLFLSEFGVDMRGSNVNDNRFLNCFMGWAAEFDVDWALWALTGSYYLRDGVAGYDETYGVYSWDWSGSRNGTMLQKISVLQSPFRGPGYTETEQHKTMFHPMTGLCVKRSLQEPLVLGPCSQAEAWSYTAQKALAVKDTYFCLQAADELGHPAQLGLVCRGSGSKWEAVSDSKMQISSNLRNGSAVCLDVDSNKIVITSACKCLDAKNIECDPASQWFKIIDSTRSSNHKTLLLNVDTAMKIIARNLPVSFAL